MEPSAAGAGPLDNPQTRRFANGDVYTGGWKNGVVSPRSVSVA